MNEVLVIICVDVDPDGFNVPGVRLTDKKGKLSWRGLEEKVPTVIDMLESVKDSQKNPANLSWFLRCDEQINEMHGIYGWLLKNFDQTWQVLKDRGDEIAWHPHFFRWFDEEGRWNQETQDVDWMLKCLENGFNGFYKLTGEIPSVRTGWAYHNNHTMKKLNDLGVKVDLSAVPGLKSEGRKVSNLFCDIHDWSTTGEGPYFPSKTDYRITGMDRLDILEIPMTVSQDPFPSSLIGMVVDNKLKSGPPRFHLSPIKDPRKFSGIIRREIKIIKKSGNKKHIGMYFHPTDFFSKDAFSMFSTNLKSIPGIMKKEKVNFSFCTAKRAASLILADMKG